MTDRLSVKEMLDFDVTEQGRILEELRSLVGKHKGNQGVLEVVSKAMELDFASDKRTIMLERYLRELLELLPDLLSDLEDYNDSYAPLGSSTKHYVEENVKKLKDLMKRMGV